MTSIERRQARYERRMEKRLNNKRKRCEELGKVEEIFNFFDLFKYGLQSCRNVRWKHSTQMFEATLFSGTAVRLKQILDGTWKPKNYVTFSLYERGKTREINAPNIRDRQPEKLLCNKVLAPLYYPTMTHANGASQVGKGLHWHYKLLVQQLSRHYRKYGREGAVLLLDLAKFFPNCKHSTVYKRHEELLGFNPKLKKIADVVIENVPTAKTGKGLPLGVEPSQQEAIALPSMIDHHITCQLGISGFGHYMDDYYVIAPDKRKAKEILHKIVQKFIENGIPINTHKCSIIPLNKPFKFCKAKFRLTETGRVVISVCRDGIKRARRKLRVLYRKYINKEITAADVMIYVVSQLAYYNKYQNFKYKMRIYRMFHALFLGG